MNPGLSYVAKTWQLALEAIVPLEWQARRGIGVRAQIPLFLDDLVSGDTKNAPARILRKSLFRRAKYRLLTAMMAAAAM